MAIKVTLLKDGNDIFGGRNRIQHASIDLDSSYPTGGYPLAPSYFFGAQAKAANIWNVLFGDAGTTGGGAYRFYYDIPNGKLMAYWAAPVGTIAAPTFTGAAGKVVNNTPAFTGTGLTAAGQVLTTTDNQTMTLNQCAGMILISATGNAAVEIASNTAVTGAPAVLTVVGKATTDAGVYSIFTGVTPTGTNSAPAFTGTAGAFVQVANATNLSAVVGLRMTIFGR